jgi:hypothetical protein
MQEAGYWIKNLRLLKHPEGGWFKEVYRSGELVEEQALPQRFTSERNFSTSIYYLLETMNKSHFHRIKSDELWHFYTGNSAIEILLIVNGKIKKLKLGPNFEKGELFQVAVPKNTWFAAHLINAEGYALVGCTVSPGFSFEDFELAQRRSLLKKYPSLKKFIIQFTKSG